METTVQVRQNGTAPFRALLFDYGGTLTASAPEAIANFCRAERIDLDHFSTVLQDWSDAPPAAASPMQAIERGEISIPAFERVFAAALRTLDGTTVDPQGLVDRFHAKVEVDPSMEGLLRHARDHRVHTALVSNSWNFDYDLRDWYEIFDTVVVSGTVGMRKPEREIYTYAAGLIGVPPEQCVFVDDSAANIAGAESAGMRGVHHIDPADTIAQVYELFGWD
jgi:HAD superfamily hydrolase (TIGR01509 family)